MCQRRNCNSILINRYAKEKMAIPLLVKDASKQRWQFLFNKRYAKGEMAVSFLPNDAPKERAQFHSYQKICQRWNGNNQSYQKMHKRMIAIPFLPKICQWRDVNSINKRYPKWDIVIRLLSKMYQRWNGNSILTKIYANGEMVIPFLPKDMSKESW